MAFADRLPDGNYAVQLAGNGVGDASGNTMANASVDFFVLAGDVNRDRVVNFADLLTVAELQQDRRGPTPRYTWTATA